MKYIIKHFKHWLIAGLFVWVPVGLTLWVVTLLLHSVDQIVPKQFTSQQIFGVHIPGIGLIFALFILLITGIIATNMFGQTILGWGNKLIMHIPIVKSIYKGIKQVSDTLLSSNGHAFRQALLVRFPHSEAWTIAFITGTPSLELTSRITNINDVDTDFINVYVPTTPNPTSGYFIIVKRRDTKTLDMTVDEALRYVISMGTVDPTK
jgi:uncharacterized membrane protein